MTLHLAFSLFKIEKRRKKEKKKRKGLMPRQRIIRRLDFSRTPVCKAMWYCGLVLSLVIMFVGGKELFWYSPVEIIQHPKQWFMRTAFSAFFYSNFLELCIGLFLLYKFRVFERNLGTKKFSVLILFSLFLNFVFNICTLTLTLSLFQSNSPELMALISPSAAAAAAASGQGAKKPSLSLMKRAAILPANGFGWFTSALFVLYVAEVPKNYNFRVFGVNMNDKWIVYTLYVQMLLAGLPNNIVPVLAGLIAGLLYNSGGLGLNEKTVGAKVSQMCTTLCLPIIDPSLAAPPAPGIQLSPEPTTQSQAPSSEQLSSSSSSSSSSFSGHKPVNNNFKDNYSAIAAAISPEERDDDENDQRRAQNGRRSRRSGRNHRNQQRQQQQQRGQTRRQQQQPSPQSEQMQSQQQYHQEEEDVDEQFQRDVEEAIRSSLMDAVDSNAVEAMVAMGFSEEQSRDVLARSGNNVEVAVARLLGN